MVCPVVAFIALPYIRQVLGYVQRSRLSVAVQAIYVWAGLCPADHLLKRLDQEIRCHWMLDFSDPGCSNQRDNSP